MQSRSIGVLTTLAATLAALPAQAAAEAASSEKLKKDDQIVVTGSRIARVAKEGPISVTIITSRDLEQQGYRNVYDALNQQTQNTGFTQGADFGNTFTPAANAVSLRGLGPNHTLVLINGRRVADYPIAYGGSINFVNLANIPSALVERIEILNAGASAIYGSDAIAGVVNVILKKRAEGVAVDLKLGTTERGGGDSRRLQLVGGREWGGLNAVFAAEISRNDPVWAKDRDFMRSTTADGEAPTVVWGRRNLATGKYLSPGEVCQRLGGLFEGSVVSYTGKRGTYCGSGEAQPAFWTTRTHNLSQNYYAGLNYTLDQGSTLFGDVLVGLNHTQNNTRGPSWTSLAVSKGYFLNQNTGNYEVWSRRFAPEELGGATRYNREWHDTAANVSLGIRGPLASTAWDYEVAYNLSSYVSRARAPRMLAGIDQYFLGPQLGTDKDGIALYKPDPARFSQVLTPEQLGSLYGHTESRDSAWSHTLSASASGDLWQLPAGPLKAAVLAEVGGQGFANRADPQMRQGVFYNVSSTPDASGSRTRYATALELRVPVLPSLQTTLAGRFDDYRFADRSDSKFTYNAGLEWRPHESLLLRGNLASSFRAPDMNYIYKSQTKGYYASTTDYYRCKLAGQPLADCEYVNYSPGANYTSNGSRDLKSENGQSHGMGLVWAPLRALDLSLDYWRVRIDDLVTNLDADGLLRTESECRTGGRDAKSSQCLDAISRITRNPSDAPLDPNAITDIRVNPINAAREETSGIDFSSRLRWKWEDIGRFVWRLNYTRVLSHDYRQFASDQERDLLRATDNHDWPDKLINTLGWTRGDWNSSLTLIRYGRIPDSAESGRMLSATVLANLDVGYQISKQASISFTVNNLLDKVKQDRSSGWPYYPVGGHSPYGREMWLQFGYQFN
ncbi:TonB-dependent receptor plug domain-containing protein [Parachitinimonas caeni]|uniref:TonB-dependent receptor n=1 Tax=Parachitinimonas caeni TaxID=3031301 RepID=A0ABT7E2X8_9NEIS|nr:TonB-dependent receptor [Parachitinimonas caeni]MDK2126677.1 TonB-dependent receptor [Parachitinimonas caeni]